MRLVNRVGIDRVEISSIGVLYINGERIEAVANAKGHSAVRILRNGDIHSKTGIQKISSITIKDNNMFQGFKVHSVKLPTACYERQFAVLDFTIGGEYGNLQNMSVEELHQFY